ETRTLARRYRRRPGVLQKLVLWASETRRPDADRRSASGISPGVFHPGGDLTSQAPGDAESCDAASCRFLSYAAATATFVARVHLSMYFTHVARRAASLVNKIPVR